MSDQFDLKEDITALDAYIEDRLERIRNLMEALKSIRTLSGEMSLLRELTTEIATLRELRQTLFTRKSVLREYEGPSNNPQDKGKAPLALVHLG
jgi:hypothetical protein